MVTAQQKKTHPGCLAHAVIGMFYGVVANQLYRGGAQSAIPTSNSSACTTVGAGCVSSTWSTAPSRLLKTSSFPTNATTRANSVPLSSLFRSRRCSADGWQRRRLWTARGPRAELRGRTPVHGTVAPGRHGHRAKLRQARPLRHLHLQSRYVLTPSAYQF